MQADTLGVAYQFSLVLSECRVEVSIDLGIVVLLGISVSVR